jgi:putative redox protein
MRRARNDQGMLMAEIVVHVDQIGTSTSRGTVRSHQVLIDRPVPKGGEDRGPLGGEYLLLSLAGCFMSNLLAAARARDIPATDLRIHAVGTLGESPERMVHATLTVSGQSAGDQLQKLATIAERACIVTNTLRLALPISVVCK